MRRAALSLLAAAAVLLQLLHGTLAQPSTAPLPFSAPLQPGAGASYGLLMIEQLADGSISVTEIEEATGNAIDSWSVTAAGQTP